MAAVAGAVWLMREIIRSVDDFRSRRRMTRVIAEREQETRQADRERWDRAARRARERQEIREAFAEIRSLPEIEPVRTLRS
jgi:hypothetical protein